MRQHKSEEVSSSTNCFFWGGGGVGTFSLLSPSYMRKLPFTSSLNHEGRDRKLKKVLREVWHPDNCHWLLGGNNSLFRGTQREYS